MVKSAQRREAVAHLKSAHQMCERRACRVAGVDRALVRYQVTKGDDADLRARLEALAHERRRFGYYRQIHVLPRREGWLVNKKRLSRGAADGEKTRRTQARLGSAGADEGA
jgi:putative transposase